MSDRLVTDPVPQVARVLLRVEWADGQIREFVAEEPHGFDCTITHPLPGLPDLRGPGVPYLITSGGETASVQIGFKAGLRHPIIMRTEPRRSLEARFAEIREWAEALDRENDPAGEALLDMLNS
jgi:hypothetical protein